MDARVHHEEEVLKEKTNQIVNLLKYLSNNDTVVSGRADQIVIKKRKAKIQEIQSISRNPYIGRMDVISKDGKCDSYYVGTVGISGDRVGEEIVIDWRSEFGKLYTTYTGGKREQPDVGELVGKRQIIIDKNHVKRVTDIGIVNLPTQTLVQGQDIQTIENITNDDFLTEILSHTSDEYKLQEIISSLQAEQDEIIRLPMDQQVIVQGVAGSGKSSVAMHRISYLLFKYEDTLSPEQILVIAPNKMFISYMQSIIPELDIQGIKQDTFLGLVLSYLPLKNVRGIHESLAGQLNAEKMDRESEEITRFKGSISFMRLLQSYIDLQVENICPRVDVKVYAEVLITKEKVAEIYKGYRHLPINLCRDKVIQSITNTITDYKNKEFDIIDQQFKIITEKWVSNLPLGSQERKNLFESLEQIEKIKKNKISNDCKEAIQKFSKSYMKKKTTQLYEDIFDVALINALNPSLKSSITELLVKHKGKTFDYENLAGLLYLEQRLNGIKDSYKYIIVDEAQDLSPFQLYILKQLTNSMTILGDITQSIYQNGIQSWDEFNDQVLGTTNIRKMQMNTSYRSTYEIMETANKVIENSNLLLPKIIPVNRKGGSPTIQKVSGGSDLLARIMDSLNQFNNKGFSKVAIIGKDLQQTEKIFKQLLEQGIKNIQLIDSDNSTLKENIVLIPSYLVKGMEFDAVIIPNVNEQRFSTDALDAKLLYICVTRAHHDLHIFYHGTISPLLHGLAGLSTLADQTLDDIL